MGLGPSIKMTTLHHFRCPATEVLTSDPDIEFAGVLLDGVSENCDQKLKTAAASAELAKQQQWDGALVAIDGWGNHHIDFTAVMEELGKRGIPTVGLSYLGQQGRLVCSNPYVGLIIDFNKSASGYESCVVGENNLTKEDAWKAWMLLKHKLKKNGCLRQNIVSAKTSSSILYRNYYPVSQISFGTKTALNGTHLVLDEAWRNGQCSSSWISGYTVSVIKPAHHHIAVNSNLDIMPAAVKRSGSCGSGITDILSGMQLMLTGCEAHSRYQPANIGSSEGILEQQLHLNRAGTPSSHDLILHMDVQFRDGGGRSADAVLEAHQLMDHMTDEIRAAILSADREPTTVIASEDLQNTGKSRIGLVKLVSGLGCMYDTAVFPRQPGGINGAFLMRSHNNMPILLTANQIRDGVIHSLV